MTEVEKKYQEANQLRKEKIRSEPNKGKRFFLWCWHGFSFPWIWAWSNLRDWKTWIVFIIVFLIVSCEIWIPYLIALIVGVDTKLGVSMMSVASACWLFWIGPGTPFMVICISLTIGIKALLNKISLKRGKNKDGV